MGVSEAVGDYVLRAKDSARTPRASRLKKTSYT
jgi:hypothetical protein